MAEQESLFTDARRWFVAGVRDNYGPLMYAAGFAMGLGGVLGGSEMTVRAFNDPVVDCCDRDAADCDCVTPEILDACCGGRMWWWDKAHPLAVYVDNRVAPAGSDAHRPNWKCEPDLVADFRSLPFADASFQLVVFDPPHITRPNPSGHVAMNYGALSPDTEQDDLRRGFLECWRVLAPGGTLIFKWAGALGRVQPFFPAPPIVGTRSLQKRGGLGTRWFVFYKPLEPDFVTEKAA